MQKMRKFLSLMLVVVFALAMMAPTTSAASFGDVPESYRYYNAVENLAARGIINGMGDGNYAPDANVKRDEFAKIVCTGILNSGEVAPTAGAGFTDVAADRWSSGYIKVAAAAGIINGMGDGTFAPENPVTYEQAIKMLVCALGYGEQALKRGEYPGGYLSQAQALGLTKGVVDGVQGQPANRGLIAKLVDNSLTVEIYDELTGTTTGSLEDNDTLKTVKGQVIAVHGQAIYADAAIETLPNRSQIVLERGSLQEVYSIEKANIDNPADFLGKMVTVYYEADNEVDYYEITRITLQEHKNKITKIDLGLLEDYTNTRIEYLPKEDADYETATVDGDAIIMVNGLLSAQTLTQVLDANLTKSGELQLLDTTGNGSASIVFVKLYDTFIINSKIDSEYKLYNKLSGAGVESSLVLNPKDRTKKITIVKDGREIAFSNLMINDVLSVAKSGDGKIIEVLVSSKGTISGMISEVSDDASILVINNKEYKVSKSYLTEAQTKLSNDVSATFYLDAFGKIAYATNIGATNAAEWKYGYLLGLQDGGSTSEELKVRLYNINGSSYTSPVTYDVDLAGGVKINGATKKTVAGVREALSASAALFNVGNAATVAGNEEYTQVIKYMLDGNMIDKIAVYDGTNDYENASVLNVDNVTAANMNATSTNKLGKYSTASAKSIVIPSNRIDGDYKSFGYYTVDTNYKAQIIDASTINQAKVVVFYSLTSVQADIVGETPMIVTSVTGRASVDGEALRTLKAIDMSGNEKTFYSDGTETYTTLTGFTKDGSLTGEETFRNLAIGDIIKVTADNKAILEEVMLVAKASLIANGTQNFVTKAEGNNGTSYTAQYRYMLGTARIVDKTNGNNLVIAPMYHTNGSFADETTDETYTGISGANVFVVDTAETNENRIVKMGVFDDILGASKVEAAEASKLFVYQSYGSIKMIVVVR